jgi:Rrf2 family protein
MNFSKTTEYALRIMSLMAKDETRLYRVNDIFDELNIPFRYLRRLMTNLTKSNLIVSVQGKNGGYRFAKTISEISLMDIVQAVGDTPFSDDCFFGFKGCALAVKCTMHDKWSEIRANIRQVLISTKLSDLRTHGPLFLGQL